MCHEPQTSRAASTVVVPASPCETLLCGKAERRQICLTSFCDDDATGFRYFSMGVASTARAEACADAGNMEIQYFIVLNRESVRRADRPDSCRLCCHSRLLCMLCSPMRADAPTCRQRAIVVKIPHMEYQILYIAAGHAFADDYSAWPSGRSRQTPAGNKHSSNKFKQQTPSDKRLRKTQQHVR